MDIRSRIEDFLTKGQDIMSGLSIDCVVFGCHEGELRVLLLKLRHASFCTLPGGFIHKTEGIDDAALRILKERTGLEDIYLEQFRVFGQVGRGSTRAHRETLAAYGITIDASHWLLQRFVSIGYYALVDHTKVTPTPDVFSESCGWYSLEDLPELILDHSDIIRSALDGLRLVLNHKLSGFKLLPETFTMAELQGVYESILGKKLQRTNFQRKMLSLGILERLDKKWTGGAHKAPYLYRFDSKLQ